jgi:hypothetical protein
VSGSIERALRDLKDTFAALEPTVVVGDRTDLAVVRLHVTGLLRALSRPLYLILIQGESLVGRLDNPEDRYAFDSTLFDVLPRDGSPVAPLIVVPPVAPRDHRLLRKCIVGQEQPIFSLDRLTRRGGPRNFKRLLLEKARPEHLNPYQTVSAASEAMFVGREEHLRDLRARNHIVVGPRRIGKTSLIRRLQRELGGLRHPGRTISDPKTKRCALVDVSLLGERVTSSLWSQILQEFGLPRRDWAAGGRIARFAGQRHEARRDVVDEAKAIVALAQIYKDQLMIILDEVDGWIQREAQRGYETLVQLRAVADNGVKVILVGYEALAIAAKDKRFPFGDRAKTMMVGPLTRASVERLVQHPIAELGIRIESEGQVMDRIWRSTGGAPDIVQEVCSHLVSGALEGHPPSLQVSPADVDTALAASGSYQDLLRGVRGAAFPLAEALAGAAAITLKRGAPRALSVSELMEPLERNGFEFDARDLELAMTFLELRFVFQPADPIRAHWWVTEAVGIATKQWIESVEQDRWFVDVLRRHKDPQWREMYGLTGQFVEN